MGWQIDYPNVVGRLVLPGGLVATCEGGLEIYTSEWQFSRGNPIVAAGIRAHVPGPYPIVLIPEEWKTLLTFQCWAQSPNTLAKPKIWLVVEGDAGQSVDTTGRFITGSQTDVQPAAHTPGKPIIRVELTTYVPNETMQYNVQYNVGLFSHFVQRYA